MTLKANSTKKSMENKQYIGLTLGPITQTLMMAESTKGLWTASYLFSYLAKQIILSFKERTFLFPAIDEGKFSSPSGGVGQFPDQYAFEAQEGDFEKMTLRINKVIEELAESIAKEIKEDEAKVRDYLNSYFKIFCTEINANPVDAIEVCKKRLALLELQGNFSDAEETRNYLGYFMENVTGSFLAQEAFESDKRLFKSCLEIAAQDHFSKNYQDDDVAKENARVEQILQQKPACYRYMAIVSADADNLTSAVQTFDKERLDEILTTVNNEAKKIIVEYGGVPVYIGGDDLFFFAPVKHEAQTILNLIDRLTENFKEKWKDITDTKNRPTLSFGVAIAYYKHPLFESVEQSRYLLECAKDPNGCKNSIALSIRKHSGQTLNLLIRRYYPKSFELMQSLPSWFNKQAKTPSDANLEFLTSIVYWLRQNTGMIWHCILKQEKQDADNAEEIQRKQIVMLTNLLKNSFNEAHHERYNDFFDSLAECIVVSYEEYRNVSPLSRVSGLDDTKDPDERIVRLVMMNIFTLLRFVKFTLSENDD